MKVKRTILRDDDGILSHYKFCLSMAFKDLRNSLIISYDDGFIDDEEFILLYDLYSSKDLDFPYDVYAPFDLDEIDEAECVAEFRFRKRDVRALAEVLRVPDTITRRVAWSFFQVRTSPGGGGGYSLIWAIRGRAAG